STTYTVSASPQNGFTGTVALSVSSALPAGVTAQFSAPSVGPSGNSTLTLATSASAQLGNFTVTIQGVSGALKHTAGVTLVIQQGVQNDTTPPTWTCCTILSLSPFTLQYTAQDTGSGMASIVVTSAINATADIPQFTVGTTSPINFTTTHTTNWSSFITLQMKDVAGNISIIDPWYLDTSRE